jgi:hypothetical protein
MSAGKYMDEHHHITDSAIGLAVAYLEKGNAVAALDILKTSQDKITDIIIKYRPVTAKAMCLTHNTTR